MFATSWNTIKLFFDPPGPSGTIQFRASSGLFRVVPEVQKYGFKVFQEAVNIILSRLRIILSSSTPVLGCFGPFQVLLCTQLEIHILPGGPKITLRVIQENAITLIGCFVCSYWCIKVIPGHSGLFRACSELFRVVPRDKNMASWHSRKPQTLF